jgi:hypothetical protein
MKKYFLNLIIGFLMGVFFVLPIIVYSAANLAQRVKGKLLLQVEQAGRVWYVNPDDGKRYEVTFGNAMDLFRKFATGITDKDLETIPVGEGLNNILLPVKYCSNTKNLEDDTHLPEIKINNESEINIVETEFQEAFLHIKSGFNYMDKDYVTNIKNKNYGMAIVNAQNAVKAYDEAYQIISNINLLTPESGQKELYSIKLKFIPVIDYAKQGAQAAELAAKYGEETQKYLNENNYDKATENYNKTIQYANSATEYNKKANDLYDELKNSLK